MPDREKVAKDLTDIGGWIAGRVGFEQAKNFLHTIDEAVALLKEQEAVEPKVEKAILDYQSWHYICGDCGGQIDIHDNYCRHCGRVVAHLSNKI